MRSIGQALVCTTVLLSGPAWAQGGGVAAAVEGLPVEGIDHVAITVSDIDSTVAFYSKALPFKVAKRFRVKGSAFPKELLSKRYPSVEIALVKMPTGTIQLMDFEPGKAATPNPRPVTAPGYSHICYQSASKDPAIKRFMSAGLQIISRFGRDDGVDIGGYGVRYAYGRDPDGIMIENESLDAPKRDEAAWITHIANVVHDPEAMLAFYTKLLGKPPHRTIAQENRPRLDDVVAIDNISIKGGWFNLGAMEIEVWHYARPLTPRPTNKRKLDEIGYNSFALRVADLKAEKARLKALAVEHSAKAVNLGSHRQIYAYDPEGNLFAVVEKARD
jgi:catechol 2,3-dioxygenase-like lactoylglutathione lyase family enzyme